MPGSLNSFFLATHFSVFPKHNPGSMGDCTGAKRKIDVKFWVNICRNLGFIPRCQVPPGYGFSFTVAFGSGTSSLLYPF